jgi:hypothetical protein
MDALALILTVAAMVMFLFAASGTTRMTTQWRAVMRSSGHG